MSYRANSLEKKDGIQKIAEPMEWCYPIVSAVKKNGDISLCMDYK